MGALAVSRQAPLSPLSGVARRVLTRHAKRVDCLKQAIVAAMDVVEQAAKRQKTNSAGLPPVAPGAQASIVTGGLSVSTLCGGVTPSAHLFEAVANLSQGATAGASTLTSGQVAGFPTQVRRCSSLMLLQSSLAAGCLESAPQTLLTPLLSRQQEGVHGGLPGTAETPRR